MYKFVIDRQIDWICVCVKGNFVFEKRLVKVERSFLCLLHSVVPVGMSPGQLDF